MAESGPLLECLVAAASDRKLAAPTLAAYRRTWMKLVAWTTAEGFDLAAIPREKARAYYTALRNIFGFCAYSLITSDVCITYVV